MERGSLAWDSFTVDDVSIEDLDEDSFRIFKKKSSENKSSSPVQDYDRNRILEELKLIRGGKLTRAAVLLFHRKPDDIIPGAFIRIGKMESDEDVSSKFELHGSLMRLSTGYISRFWKQVIYRLFFPTMVMTELKTYPYPELAFEGSYIQFFNAFRLVCGRAYSG
jgi:ATP-dependent DNA helicase RecG